MAKKFERHKFIGDLATAVEEKETAARLGIEMVQRGIERLFFVGCGASNKAMAIVNYWVERVAKDLEVELYYPAEFINQDPPRLGEKSLVILASHSGTTKETVQAAEFIQNKPCVSIGVTQTADAPLAKAVDHPMLYGKTQEGYFARYILVQALVGSMLKKLEGWELHDQVMSSLDALPTALATVIEASDDRATEEARVYRDDRNLYVVGSGPCFSTAYVLGVCILMESQWMHCYPVEGAEFFHGPFEIVDETIPLILLVGEDPSRPEAERVVDFCRRYTERLMIYDSTDFNLDGIAENVRPLVSPLVLQAALEPLTRHLAVWHNQPLDTRRYMGKTDY